MGQTGSTNALNRELNHVARNTNDTGRARRLVAAGADLRSTNGYPWYHTPLHQAAFHGRFAMAETLVALGAPLDLHSNPCGRGTTGTPIELARGGGHHRIVQMLEAAAKGTCGKGSWVCLKNVDMCNQGDVEFVRNWRQGGKSVEDLRRMAEARGHMAFSIDPSGRHFKHCAFKRFDYQLTPAHCTPSPGEIHIFTPAGGGAAAAAAGGGGGDAPAKAAEPEEEEEDMGFDLFD